MRDKVPRAAKMFASVAVMPPPYMSSGHLGPKVSRPYTVILPSIADLIQCGAFSL